MQVASNLIVSDHPKLPKAGPSRMKLPHSLDRLATTLAQPIGLLL